MINTFKMMILMQLNYKIFINFLMEVFIVANEKMVSVMVKENIIALMIAIIKVFGKMINNKGMVK